MSDSFEDDDSLMKLTDGSQPHCPLLQMIYKYEMNAYRHSMPNNRKKMSIWIQNEYNYILFILIECNLFCFNKNLVFKQ